MMKLAILLILLLVVAAACVFAGSLDYLTNQSAEYFMGGSRTGATDGAGIVPYNPAGTAFLPKGFHLDLSNQYLFKSYKGKESEALDDSYSQSKPTPFLPDLFMVYNFGRVGSGNLSVYGQAGIVAGGGDLDWQDGSVGSNALAASTAASVAKSLSAAGATTSVSGYGTSLEASSKYYGFGLGLGYSFWDDRLAASAGLRYTIAKRSAKIDGDIDLNTTAFGGAWRLSFTDEWDYSASGFTPVFGLDLRPIDDLNIGLRYEMETRLRFEYDMGDRKASSSSAAAATQSAAAGVEAKLPDYDGVKTDQDLPQILSIGAEYRFSPSFSLGFAGTAFFLGAADMDGLEDYFTTGYELSLSAKYKAAERLGLGAAVTYTNQGAKDSLFEDSDTLLTSSTNPILNSVTSGIGAQYSITGNLDLLASFGWIEYLPRSAETDSGLDVSYEKRIIEVGIGAKYKL